VSHILQVIQYRDDDNEQHKSFPIYQIVHMIYIDIEGRGARLDILLQSIPNNFTLKRYFPIPFISNLDTNALHNHKSPLVYGIISLFDCRRRC